MKMIDSLQKHCDDIRSLSMQTCAAMLTPAGRGAVATVAVRGTRATESVAQFFQAANRKLLADQPTGRICYGRWQHDASHEDIVVCRFKDRIEIQTHGGRSAPESVLNALKSAGCVILSWQDWLLLTEINPVQAIIAIALADTRTKLAADVLQAQYDGSLLKELKSIESLLSSQVESKTNAAHKNSNSTQLDEIASRLGTLIDSARWGLQLLTPRKVIIAGPPNAGKSSLLNALVGYDRAIVFDQPGTTRDVVTAQASYNGWLLEFRDTAGLRESTEDRIERAGIDRTTDELINAETIILVFDGTIPWNAEQQKLVEQHPSAIIVLNKSDERDFLNKTTGLPEQTLSRAVSLSARERTNLVQLFERILSEFVPTLLDITQPNLFEPMLLEFVKKMRQNLDKGTSEIQESLIDLRLLIENRPNS